MNKTLNKLPQTKLTHDIDARYKMDEYFITKTELEYLADKVNQLKELTNQICKNKIENIGKD